MGRRIVVKVGSGVLSGGGEGLSGATLRRLAAEIAAARAAGDDLRHRGRYLNARSTLLTLLRLGVVPVVNENDTVAVEEIKFGDNDGLSALVAGLVDANLLVLLTDQDGLYTED